MDRLQPYPYAFLAVAAVTALFLMHETWAALSHGESFDIMTTCGALAVLSALYVIGKQPESAKEPIS